MPDPGNKIGIGLVPQSGGDVYNKAIQFPEKGFHRAPNPGLRKENLIGLYAEFLQVKAFFLPGGASADLISFPEQGGGQRRSQPPASQDADPLTQNEAF